MSMPLVFSPGATVVDLECGTGRSFPWLERTYTDPGGLAFLSRIISLVRSAERSLVAPAGVPYIVIANTIVT